MKNWLVLQNFYNGLTPMSKGHLNAAAGGAILSLTINDATTLINKMVENQAWGEERAPIKAQKGTHTVKEADVLTEKIDLLLEKLDKRGIENTSGAINSIDSRMTCEVYGNVGHSGNDCPETHEKAAYINNRFRQQQGGSNGWNNQSRPPF